PNLARNLADTPGVTLTAIADSRPARLEQVTRRYPGAAALTSAHDLVPRPDVEAVVIAPPLGTHYSLAPPPIRAGKHVLAEKPLASSRREAEELGELADRHRATLMVDHTFVYTGAVRAIRAMVDRGDVGELLYLDSVRINLGLFQHDANVIWDLAAHDLAVLDYLVAERPMAVSASGSAVAGFRHENIAYISVHYASGFLAHFHVNWLAPMKIRRMLVGGRQRMLFYDHTEPSPQV